MDDGAKARNRLIAYTVVRLGGFAIFIFGVAIIYTDVMRPGGWPQFGAIVAILGVLDSVVAPWILRRAWARQDREQQ